MRYALTIVLLCMAALPISAGPKIKIHKVENTTCNAHTGPDCEKSHTNLVIHYDLSNTNKKNKHFVSLFASRDGGQTYNEVEVENVTGDVGYTDAGEEKVIIWETGLDMPEGSYDSMRIKIMADEYVPEITQLYMTNVKVRSEKPSKVHFRFALRDQCNHAVIVPPSVIKKNLKIYENNEEIDYSESAFFVHNACRSRLKTAIVLDFSQSMASIGAIDNMVTAARRLIDQLATHHTVALAAYYDRNVDPVALLPEATSDKKALHNALNKFVESDYVPGATRAWDGIKRGLELLGSTASFDTVKVLVALTDGNDNSSLATPTQLRTMAALANAQVNIIAFGDNVDNLTLNTLAAGTGGAVYSSETPQEIEEAFEIINHDLSGQYIVTYMGQRRFDTDVTVKIAPSVNGRIASYAHKVNFSEIYDDDRVGHLYAYRSLTTSEGTFLNVEASHVPRAVKKLRFRIDTELPYTIKVPWEGQGGVLQGWTLSEPDNQGFRTISSDQSAAFADFGFLFNVIFEELPADGYVVPFELDNTIYPTGYSFDHPDALLLGDTVVAPGISICSKAVVTVDEPVSMCASIDDATSNIESWEWDLDGDGVFDEIVTGDCPTVLSVDYHYKETGEYRTLLRVKHKYAGYIVDTFELQVAEDPCPGCEQYFAELVRIPATGDTLIMEKEKVVMDHDYMMSSTEVNQGEYYMIMRVHPWMIEGGQTGPGISETRPAWNITWYDAALFCNARSKIEGLDTVYSYTTLEGTPGMHCRLYGLTVNEIANGYRLPSEEEWQYAYGAAYTFVEESSCGGETGYINDRFFWGNSDEESVVATKAWYSNNTDGVGTAEYEADLPGPQPVATKTPNRFGLYDMAGNVAEWTGEIVNTCESPCSGGGDAVVRGGSWIDPVNALETEAETIQPQARHNSRIGFRLVRSVE